MHCLECLQSSVPPLFSFANCKLPATLNFGVYWLTRKSDLFSTAEAAAEAAFAMALLSY